MAVILAYGSPALGHLFPLAKLLGELAHRGHEVHLRTLAAGVSVGRQLGVHTEPVDPRVEAIVGEDWAARSALGVLATTMDVLCERAALEVDDLLAAQARVRPDVVIIDVNCWGAMSSADANELPWLVFSPFTPFLRAPGVPPFGPGLRPWPGIPGRIRDLGVRAVVRRVFDDRTMPRINALRARIGVAAVGSVDDFLRRAPLMLVATGKPFEYPGVQWGDAVHMIGPCTFDPAADQDVQLPEFDRPVVLVSTSSIRQADTELGAVALAALADEPVHVVATFPAGVPSGLPRSPNSTVARFLPHGPVLDRAACAVTHGGMGVTQKALARGVPVCAVPFARDQFEVARRVQMARCGTRLPAKKLSGPRLLAGVRKAMTMTAGARQVADGFLATGGVARGADLVEQHLAGSTPTTGR